MSGHPETLLEMARRHVCEGVMRVARQEEIVAALDRRYQLPIAGGLGQGDTGNPELIAQSDETPFAVD